MNSLKIVTVATDSKYYLPYLKESVQNNGAELVILGYGKEWSGFNLKYSLMIDYLKTLNNTDIVCFVDGYDVICTRNLKELPDTFLKLKEMYNCKIIVGEDKMNMGDIMNLISRNFIYYFFGGTCKERFVNSGTYIGFANDILNIIKSIYQLSNSNTSDDQIQMKKYCRENKSDFHIDVNSEIFLTMNNPYYDIDNVVKIDKNKNLYYNNSKPFFIHAPAGTFLDNILSKLGYSTDFKIREQIKNDAFKKYSMYFSPTFYENTFGESSIRKYLFIYFIIAIIILVVTFIYMFHKNIKHYTKHYTKHYKK